MFISFDGIDGAGKSTQVALFVEWLQQAGRETLACRDPGSTPLGEAVRGILLHRHDLQIHRRCEMLLYMAARAQMVEEVIRPALAAGKIVVADRYLLANVVYQAYAGGLDVAEVKRVGETAVAGVTPDLTMILDIPAEAAASRLTRSLDRMESQGLEYLQRVRAGFLQEAALCEGSICVIDAAGEVTSVQAAIRAAAAARLQLP